MKRLSNALQILAGGIAAVFIAIGFGILVLILTLATVGGIVLGAVRRK